MPKVFNVISSIEIVKTEYSEEGKNNFQITKANWEFLLNGRFLRLDFGKFNFDVSF